MYSISNHTTLVWQRERRLLCVCKKSIYLVAPNPTSTGSIVTAWLVIE